MYLTRHATPSGPRWARDGLYLPASFSLRLVLELPANVAREVLAALPTGEAAGDPLLTPVEPDHEVWASGVTYLRSRDARMAESVVKDIYDLVYEAERPELFFKAPGWRVVGHGQPVRVRRDSDWNVPEPELAVVFTRSLELIGYTVGNDVSSRSIEGANPLYLAQAKVYDGAAALGPGIVVEDPSALEALPVHLLVHRDGVVVFAGEASTAQMKRSPAELVRWLGRELQFPWGGVLMTGTGIVPPDEFTLQPGDHVQVTVGRLALENPVI